MPAATAARATTTLALAAHPAAARCAAAPPPAASARSGIARTCLAPQGPVLARPAGLRAHSRRPAGSPSRATGRAARGAVMASGDVTPAVIIGGGRVGSALKDMGGGDDIIVRRGEPIPTGTTGPIFVCTRNDSLQGIVDACPPERREDLVFMQNGMLDPWLQSIGLANATQVLVYFAVAKLGEAPTDGITDMNPEGLTAACGKWAEAAAARFGSGGLTCKVLEESEFKTSMMEKLIWICAFMLVGARHPGATVGDVESTHRAEVTALIDELAAAATSEAGVQFGPQVAERLCAYARSVAHFPTAVKEFEWRNGYFHSLSQAAAAAGRADPCPTHTAWLKEVGAI